MVRPRWRHDHGRYLYDTPAAVGGDHPATAARSPGSDQRLRPERRLGRVLVATSAALAALSLAVPNLWPTPVLADPESPIRQLVAVSDEQNLPTWFNVVVLAHAASASLFVSGLMRHAGRPQLARGWAAMAVIVALLSLDDLAAVHERLEPLGRDLGGGSGALHFAWVIPGIAAGALVAGVVAWLARHSCGPTRGYLLAGSGLLVGTALGLEIVNGLLMSETGPSRAYVLGTTLEELSEAIGAALLVCAPLATLDIRVDATHNIRVGIDPTAIPQRPRHLKRTVAAPAPSRRLPAGARRPSWWASTPHQVPL